MQFRLSTTILVLALFAISWAWYADRTSFDAKLESAVDAIELVGALDSVAARNQELTNVEPARANNLRHWLASAIIEIHEESDAIDACMQTLHRTDNALYIANHYLSEIGCETTEDYFSLLEGNRFLQEKKRGYLMRNTSQHKALALLVSCSLASPKTLKLVLEDLEAIFEEEFNDG